MLDLDMWQQFLMQQEVYCRDFMDFSQEMTYQEIQFAMDASRNCLLGFGGHCGPSWMKGAWNGLIEKLEPSIEYLELFALVAGVLAWGDRISNRRVVLYSDNLSICYMVNQTSSTCKNCMVLIRKLVLHCLMINTRIIVRHLPSASNEIADSLSRFEMARFEKVSKARGLKMEKYSTKIPESIWPFEKMWME